jgi:hemerythrin-like domain-containing protein
MSVPSSFTRRGFLWAGAAGAGVAAAWPRELAAAEGPEIDPKTKPEEKPQEKPGAKPGAKDEEEVSAAEDLMREHGVLRRVLMIYDETDRRLTARQQFKAEILQNAARLVHRFVEDYHEKLEENEIFPRMEKDRQLAALVATLRAQHAAGRVETDRILKLATDAEVKSADSRAKLQNAMRAFAWMYRPHAAREDTVLFPAMHRIWMPAEYATLGDKFEEQERKVLGEEGFEKAVDEVAALEKALGIEDLARFTPKQ